MQATGLIAGPPVHLDGDPLTVTVWHGEKPLAEEARAS
jgi:hypothetical protein